LTILCRDGFEAPVAHRLADWLATDAAGEWHLLDLGGVEESDATIRQFAERFEQHGHIVDTRAESNCWRTGLPSDWQQFLAGLTSSRRARTRALLRAAFENGPAVLHAVESPADLEHAFPILIDLHQKRRRSLSQPGCFASPRFTAFHREVAGRLLAAGHLRLMWTEWDSRPMSVDYGFVGGDTVYYYQGGFDPDLSAHSPGWLSNAVSLKRAIEQGYRSYDFLRGDESYKSSWQASVRPLVRLRIVGSQATARARYATWRGSETLKSWTRQVLSRTKG
jgi:CelD/BcsL family acetyltransferase involved in cellulose biosynthesis